MLVQTATHLYDKFASDLEPDYQTGQPFDLCLRQLFREILIERNEEKCQSHPLDLCLNANFLRKNSFEK
jgi:hypothetical protein